VLLVFYSLVKLLSTRLLLHFYWNSDRLKRLGIMANMLSAFGFVAHKLYSGAWQSVEFQLQQEECETLSKLYSTIWPPYSRV
jgi:hypothetical protein